MPYTSKKPQKRAAILGSGLMQTEKLANHRFLLIFISVFTKCFEFLIESISSLGIFLVSQNWRQLENNHTEDHTEKIFCGINMKPKKTFPLSTNAKSEKYLGKRKDSMRITRKIWNSMGNTLLKTLSMRTFADRTRCHCSIIFV